MVAWYIIMIYVYHCLILPKYAVLQNTTSVLRDLVYSFYSLDDNQIISFMIFIFLCIHKNTWNVISDVYYVVYMLRELNGIGIGLKKTVITLGWILSKPSSKLVFIAFDF